MELVTPQIGLIFWTTIVFTLLLIVLKKFAWKPILDSIDERNKSIEDALKAADKAKEEMASLNADNQRILIEAKKERDLLLKEAREIKETIISEAKKNATVEADKIIISAKSEINNDKMKALVELKNHIAGLSIEMAEKILKSELSDKNKQKELIENALKGSELNQVK
jgi:F-type H+-transporting ATPase subunit b